MYYVRRALVHSFVWLTAAATLLAGTPHVQCRCPDGTFKPVCFAPVGMEPCCCCAETDADEPPSCCQPKKRNQADDGPVFGHDGCQRTVVEPDPATAQRGDVEKEQAAVTSMANVAGVVTAVASQPSVSITSSTPVLPPLDLQLVLQHFLI